MLSKSQISHNVMKYRKEGNLEIAIEEATRGTQLYSKNNFFYKIKGDLLLEQRMFSEAADVYTVFLECLTEDNIQSFRHFVKFWRSYLQNVDSSEAQKLYQNIKKRVDNGSFDIAVCRELVKLFWRERTEPDISFQDLIERDNQYVSKWIKDLEKSMRLWKMFSFLYWFDERIESGDIDLEKNRCIVRNALYTVSVMERYGLYQEAIKLVEWVLRKSSDEVAIRSLFRLCRKIGSYESADKYLSIHPEAVDRGQFNIQYELFYYYLSLRDEERLQRTLQYLRQSAGRSIPISRTLQSFYIRLGKFDEAQDIQKNISFMLEREQSKKKRSPKGEAEEIEATEGTFHAYKNIVSEQEHTRQLNAMKELLRGFSHELGQPITNIRYGIQLYQMKMQRHMESPEMLNTLLNNILKQTERLHGLLKIFSPVVDGKEEKRTFNCINSIRQVFDDMQPRLEKIGICYDIEGIESFYVYGDPIKFDQVFYNLIINSADELINRSGEKKIFVNTEIINGQLRIIFRDNGGGIPKDISRKIFHPFFSTKTKDVSDSGTGLGLYIVWNIIKMYRGTIYVNSRYMSGAEFIITLPKGEMKYVSNTYR